MPKLKVKGFGVDVRVWARCWQGQLYFGGAWLEDLAAKRSGRQRPWRLGGSANLNSLLENMDGDVVDLRLFQCRTSVASPPSMLASLASSGWLLRQGQG
jgi:hypothetical protein